MHSRNRAVAVTIKRKRCLHPIRYFAAVASFNLNNEHEHLLVPQEALAQPVAARPATVNELYRTAASLPELKPGSYELNLTRGTFPPGMPSNPRTIARARRSTSSSRASARTRRWPRPLVGTAILMRTGKRRSAAVVASRALSGILRELVSTKVERSVRR